MVRGMRIVAVAMMLLGILLIISYIISPLRLLWWWFRHMPFPLQIGFGVAGVGLVILFTTMLFERVANRSYDKELKDT